MNPALRYLEQLACRHESEAKAIREWIEFFVASSGQEYPKPAAFPDDGHDGEMQRLLLDVDETARLFSSSKTTVRRLVASGELPAVRVGKLLRLRASDVEEYVNRLPADAKESA